MCDEATQERRYVPVYPENQQQSGRGWQTQFRVNVPRLGHPGRRFTTTEIDVQVLELADPYILQVTIRESRGATRHRVTLSVADYERLSGGVASLEALVSESFRFLLEREPKEAILRSFDLPVIGRYFPEYERVIRKRI